jgi:hypothetical protein
MILNPVQVKIFKYGERVPEFKTQQYPFLQSGVKFILTLPSGWFSTWADSLFPQSEMALYI